MKTLLEVRNLHKSYGPNVLFDDASAIFVEKQKVGLIGRNGAGKSTLCKVILGQEEADSGEIVKSTDLRLSYLEQHDPFQPDETVEAFLMRYTGRESWECGKVAGRFQIKREKFSDMPIGSLSGGYQTRVKLTAMLLREPNFLILDEPTNFLDLNTLILLEQFFQDFNGGFLIVSHDREFLKKTCNETLEAENGRLTLYPGDVEAYFGYKEEQRLQAEQFNRNVELKQKELQTFVDRFRAKASKAAQAQSKLKQLQKLHKIEIEHPMSRVRIALPQLQPKKGVSLRCEDLTVGYPGKQVVRHVDLALKRGARIAVLGENGQGKTTFLKTIAGQLPALRGAFKWGEGLEIAYYAQHVYAHLDARSDLQTYLERQASPEVTRQEVLNMAGCFLFRGDDVKKNISVLSGGERARLVLAGLLLSKKNVLLLDEPTNHLDFETVEALAQALKSYQGSLFFISHDRTFVNLVATEIIEIKDGRASLFPDSYEIYVDRLERGAEDERRADEPAKPAKVHSQSKVSHQQRKALQSQITQVSTKIRKLDDAMATEQREKDAILREFAENPRAYSRERAHRLEELNESLQRAEEQWLALQDQVEQLEARLRD